jgi:ABC-2 type transport system ATP-binding protein
VSRGEDVSIIEATGLARTFQTRTGTVSAVSGVDLAVEAGEIIGFLGPNGAGKTTTLRMLTTLLRPTAGTARIVGADLLAEPALVRRRIGYVAQSGGTDPACFVAEELILQAQLHRIDRTEARRRAAVLFEQLDLSGMAGREVKTLSGGQRRRLDIALGLVHAPPLVFLDEPTTGLDPQSRSNLWAHIRRLRDDTATTVFLTTHYLDEADALCDRVLVIDHGQIVAEGSPDDLKRRFGGDVVAIGIAVGAARAGQVLAAHPGVRDTIVGESGLRLVVEDGERTLADLIRLLDGEGIALQSIQLARPTLEDVFLTLTGRTLRDEVPA